MGKYIYKTEVLGTFRTRKSLKTKLQKLLDQMSKEGWELSKISFSGSFSTCCVILQKEA